MGISSWVSKIWLHEYLISLIEIGVNWPSSKQLWIRPIYTDFKAITSILVVVSLSPYLRPPWTNLCPICCVRVFYHVLLKYGHENAKMQKKKNKKKKKRWRNTVVLSRPGLSNPRSAGHMRPVRQLCVAPQWQILPYIFHIFSESRK